MIQKGVFPYKTLFPNVGNGNAINSLKKWVENSPPAQRIVVNKIISKLENVNNGDDISESTIDYKIDKEVAAPFNMILGAQYQFNKRWMLRTD